MFYKVTLGCRFDNHSCTVEQVANIPVGKEHNTIYEGREHEWYTYSPAEDVEMAKGELRVHALQVMYNYERKAHEIGYYMGIGK